MLFDCGLIIPQFLTAGGEVIVARALTRHALLQWLKVTRRTLLALNQDRTQRRLTAVTRTLVASCTGIRGNAMLAHPGASAWSPADTAGAGEFSPYRAYYSGSSLTLLVFEH